MDMKQVKSSNIRVVGYDAEARILAVDFTATGTYRYTDVPQAVADQLLAADSVGAAFHRLIRGRYETARNKR